MLAVLTVALLSFVGSAAVRNLNHELRLDLLVEGLLRRQRRAPTGVPTVEFCNATLTPAVIDSYSWTPLDVAPGETVTANCKFTLYEDVSGGLLSVAMKAFGVTVLDEDYDLCDILSEFDVICPLQKGYWNLTETVTLPNLPVRGKVDAHIVATDQNGVMLGCADVSVKI